MDDIPTRTARRGQGRARAVQEAINAGVYVSAGLENQPASIVATDGAVTDGLYREGDRRIHAVDGPLREEVRRAARSPPLPLRARGPGIGADPELDVYSARPIAGGDVPTGLIAGDPRARAGPALAAV